MAEPELQQLHEDIPLHGLLACRYQTVLMDIQAHRHRRASKVPGHLLDGLQPEVLSQLGLVLVGPPLMLGLGDLLLPYPFCSHVSLSF